MFVPAAMVVGIGLPRGEGERGSGCGVADEKRRVIVVIWSRGPEGRGRGMYEVVGIKGKNK